MIGTVLDRKYRIVELIGSGGMAQVYKAVNMANRKTVAVKVLKDEYKDDAEFLRRFSRETNAILTLSHENIVRAYGAGTHDGMPYLVMEYVEGHTLKDLISKNGALPVRTAIGITCQILDALSAAHAHGIIHRDVKPQNVIVTDKGRVKLADFGIAREAKASTVTFSGQKVLGSVHYISPEQAKGTMTTEQSDLYSVGVCLYEMLTGKVPFDSDSTVTIALMHLQDDPVPPIDLVPDLPAALNDIVLKSLQKDPENRYQTARAMRSDLVRSLSDPSGSFVGEPEEKKQKSLRKKPSVYILIALCVFLPIAIIGVVVLIYASSRPKESEPDRSIPETDVVMLSAEPQPDETIEPEADIFQMKSIPNLIGYSLDDALHVLYHEVGFRYLIVEYTDVPPDDMRNNTVVAIYVCESPGDAYTQELLFEAAPAREITPIDVPTPSSETLASPTPASDSDTVIDESTPEPTAETVPFDTPPATEYAVHDISVTPTPQPSFAPEQTDQLFSTGAYIRLRVYRSTIWTYKADVSYPLSIRNDNSSNLIEIGLETNNIEEIPYRAVLYSHLRNREAKTDLNETATIYWFEPISRTLNLYINGEDMQSPQPVVFSK